jgi:hypothetical protein
LTEDMLNTLVFQQLKDLTASSDRLHGWQTLPTARMVKAASQ